MTAPVLTVAVHSKCRMAGEALAASLAAQVGVHVVGSTQQWSHLSRVCRLRSPEVIVVNDADEVEAAMVHIGHVTARWQVGRVIFLTHSARPAISVTWHFIAQDRGLDALLAALSEYRDSHLPLSRRLGLTDRELQVLTMVGAGLTAPQIAIRLAIGQRSVENHKRRIYAKLGAHSQAQAISAVAPLGMIPGGRAASTVSELSRREEQILRLAASGQSSRQIARELGIAPKTVESLSTSLYRKLGVHSRASALAVAHANGLLHP